MKVSSRPPVGVDTTYSQLAGAAAHPHPPWPASDFQNACVCSARKSSSVCSRLACRPAIRGWFFTAMQTRVGHARLGLTVPRRVGGAVAAESLEAPVARSVSLKSTRTAGNRLCMHSALASRRPNCRQLMESLRTAGTSTRAKIAVARKGCTAAAPAAISGERSSPAIEPPQ